MIHYSLLPTYLVVEYITSFYVGEDGSEELANELAQEIAEEFEDVEVEILN